MPQKLSALPKGARIKYYQMFDAPIQWTVLEHGHAGMPLNTTTVYMTYINALMCFDAKEPSNSDNNRKQYGNNDWGVSNLRSWANSEASAGNWYSAKHAADTPPSSAYVYQSWNPYDTWKGFMADMTEDEKKIVQATTRQYSGWSGNSTTSIDYFFPLTSVEVGLESIAGNGTKFDYFTDNNSRIATCTAQCIAHSNYQSNPSTGSGWIYWLQNSYPSNSYYVRHVFTNGTLNGDPAYDGYFGLRLACNLSSDILVSDSTDGDGCYTILYNQPPTAPATITVPETVRSTTGTTISWSAATDPEAQSVGYVLQCKLTQAEMGQEATWGEIYRGPNRSFVHTIAQGTLSVQYRVQAYDNLGLTSGWTTSQVKSVINNQPPVINAGAIDFAIVQMTAPKLQYTITDADEGEVTVTEYLDEEVLKNETVELGQTRILTVDGEKWKNVLNGNHVYKIVATDDYGDSSTAQATFQKMVTAVDFTLTNPMTADERPTAAIINVSGAFPAGCELKIELCNNGNDEMPTWVDATNAARNGLKVFFSNEDKTDESWAVGLKVHLARSSAVGDCYISALGGNFQ